MHRMINEPVVRFAPAAVVRDAVLCPGVRRAAPIGPGAGGVAPPGE